MFPRSTSRRACDLFVMMSTAPDGLLTIIAALDRCVVIDKPAGLLSVPGKGPDKRDCVEARLRAMFPDATGPIICHRLDMETSGLMVAALDAEAHRDLSIQFQERKVEKRYVALVQGAPRAQEGVIELKQRLDVDNRPHQILDPERGKLAVTRWRVIEKGANLPAHYTRLELTPTTGRTHQLRIACAASPPDGLGCPIVGDTLYGAGIAQASRMMLGACFLAFREPGAPAARSFQIAAPF